MNLTAGARIKAYDLKAMEEAGKFYLKDMPEVEYSQSKYSVLNGCDALILLTEWLVATSLSGRDFVPARQ